MLALHTNFILIALVAIPLQVEYGLCSMPGARPQNRVSKEAESASGDRAQAQPESSPPSATAQRKVPEPVAINYQNGELEIDAVDAPLSDILRAVVRRTGVLINIPQNAGERVTRHVGPGRAIVVLGSLLNESKFNYLIVEPSAGQDAPVRVNLFAKAGATHAQRPIEATDLGVAPVNELALGTDPRPAMMAERRELMREIAELRLKIIEQGQKDRERR